MAQAAKARRLQLFDTTIKAREKEQKWLRQDRPLRGDYTFHVVVSTLLNMIIISSAFWTKCENSPLFENIDLKEKSLTNHSPKVNWV
jgi:hypothetical protein